MAGNPELQNLDSFAVPDPVTPADTPSSPSGYASVTPHGQGPAPYDIQAAQMQDEITSALGEANAVAGAGFLYPQGPRQAMTETLLQSPQGFAVDGYDIDEGFHGGQGGDPGWPNNVEPGG
jgi:hypothetical protein